MKKIIFVFALALGIGSTLAQKPQPTPKPRISTEAPQKPQPVKPRTGTDSSEQKGQTTKAREGNDAAQQKGKPGQPVQPCCGVSANATRVTAADLSRTPAGKNYVVDLTKRGAVFDLDSTSRSIDFSRIMVRTRGGNVSMETLLKKLLPATADRSVLRIGRPKELSRGKASQIGGKINYTCPPGEPCKCTGDDDCNNMFGAGVCGDIAVCYPTGCSCLPPIKN